MNHEAETAGLRSALRLQKIQLERANLKAARTAMDLASALVDRSAFDLRLAELLSQGTATDQDEFLILYLKTGREDHRLRWLAAQVEATP